MPELAALLEMIGSRLADTVIECSPQRQSVHRLPDDAGGTGRGPGAVGPPLSALIAAPPPELKPALSGSRRLWPAAASARRLDRPSPRAAGRRSTVLARGRPDLAETVIPALLSRDTAR